MREVHHATVFFHGHVQGVGFRYCAMEVARGYEVTGFVQNLADGRVVLEAEGDPQEVEAFVAAVEERMQHFIRKSDRSTHARAAQFTVFVIR